MKDSELITSSMQQVKAPGIQCSIDDFGTGYSSLKYLPIDKIKIDRSFISSLAKNLTDDAISREIIAGNEQLEFDCIELSRRKNLMRSSSRV